MSESDLKSFSNESDSDIYGESEPAQITDSKFEVKSTDSEIIALLKEQLSDLKLKYEENTSLKVAMKDIEALFEKTDEICQSQAVKIEELKKSEQEKLKEINELKEHIGVQAFVIRDLEQINLDSQATISSLNCQARLKYEDEQRLKATANCLQKRNEELTEICIQQHVKNTDLLRESSESKAEMKMELMEKAIEIERLEGSDHITGRIFDNVGSLLSTVIKSSLK